MADSTAQHLLYCTVPHKQQPELLHCQYLACMARID